MRSLLILLLSFLAVIVPVAAQSQSAGIVFRNNQTEEQSKIMKGDRVKLWSIDGTVTKRHVGSFKGVADGAMILSGSQKVALDNITDIKFRPKSARWLGWGLFFIGLMLGGIAFPLVFAEYALAVALAKGALVAIGLSIVITLGTANRIRNVNTNWTYEYYSPPEPRNQT